ncbi:MAG TPA: ATP-binding cassette domain-containing protein [Kofleriaceae bacterium]|nr:ATP-binding cassette domain-containing protein [Kofleriaceae bacterium]
MGAIAPALDRPILELRQVSVGYGRAPVLTGIDIEVARGELLALIGPSGCGKTTLLRTILGLKPPLAGQVLLFGQDLYAVTPDERAAMLGRTGLVFQKNALFGSMTVFENVCLPARELTSLPDPVVREMAWHRLRLFGLAELAHRWPSEISGGQQKRVALARASLLDPEITFCDEPTAGLDPLVSAVIDSALRRFCDALGSTVVAVTHDMATVEKIADRVLLLGGGRIYAAGTPAELAESDDPEVHAFWHRDPPPDADAGAVLDELEAS